MRGVMLAVALGCAALTSAPAPVEAAVVSQSSQERAFQDWMSELMLWSQGFQTTGQRQIDLINTVFNGADTAIAYFESGDHAGGRAWAQTWRAERQAEIDALNALVANLDATPPQAPAVLGADAVEINAMLDRFSALPAVFGEANRTFVADVTDMMDVIEGIAGGDEAALARAPGLITTSLIAIGRNSVVSMETSLAMIPDPEHPQAHLIRSSIAGERAVIVYFQHLKTSVTGGRPDSAGAARQIRAHADESQAHAASIRAAAATVRQRMGAALAPGEVSTRINRALDTYEESAVIEERLAVCLRAIAALIERGELTDSLALDEELARLEQIVINRSEVDTLRRALMAG